MTQDAPLNPGAPPVPAPTAGEFVAADPAIPSPAPTSAPGPAPRGIPTLVLKPGEVITWIKIERPRLELGQVLTGSFVLVGLILAIAVVIGVALGHLRSKSTEAHGAGGLDLR